MMTTKPRTNEPHVNIVTRSGATTRKDKEDGKKETEATWVRNTIEKVPMFDIHKKNKSLWKRSEALWCSIFDTKPSFENTRT